MNLAREQIEQMPADREMDALIAKNVMGWGGVAYCDHCYDWRGLVPRSISGIARFVPEYSTNIAAAWTVVEKMRKSPDVFVRFVDALRGMTSGRPYDEAIYNVLLFLTPERACRAALIATLENNK